MKIFYTLLLIVMVSPYSKAQYSVSTNATIGEADLAVSINTSTANADLDVMIGQDLNTSNFSIGFTDDPAEADVLITDSEADTDFQIVKSGLKDSNFSVKYGEKIINPDFRIEVIEEGAVDYLVYYETEDFNIESLILGLLPIINANLGYTYQVIPYYGPEGGPPVEEPKETHIIEPIEYKNMAVEHWIIAINDGIIQLDDNSYFYIYDEDRNMSKLWQEKNDVVVSPTNVFGHYYITKDGGIYKEAEALRAICFMPK